MQNWKQKTERHKFLSTRGTSVKMTASSIRILYSIYTKLINSNQFNSSTI